MKVKISPLGRAALLGALVTASGLALADDALPAVHHDGAVAYLSGGIGQGEAKAIEKVEHQWPVTLEFAQHDGSRADFAANVDVVVRSTAGQPTLQATSTGPFLLAKLPPGRYVVDATLDGKTLHDRVTVREGRPAKAVLVWPAGTDES